MSDYATLGKAVRALALGIIVAGCSTGYRAASTGPFGDTSTGYEEEAGPGGLIKVTYRGQNRMLMYQVQDYTLYRCAEIAQLQGSPYFVLYQTLPAALENRSSTEVRPTTLLGIPHAEVYIGLRKTAAPGLLSTADVLARLKPTIDAGQK